MNLFDLLANFWRVDEQKSFTGNETRLFFFLIHLANRSFWSEWIEFADKKMVVNANISPQVLKSARERLKEAICVERQTSVFNTKEKAYKDKSEAAVYIANYKVDATQSNSLIRKHWHIENKDHHVKDTTLREDESRIRVNPENMSTIRSFALNILRKNNIENSKGELYENSLDLYALYSYKHFI